MIIKYLRGYDPEEEITVSRIEIKEDEDDIEAPFFNLVTKDGSRVPATHLFWDYSENILVASLPDNW